MVLQRDRRFQIHHVPEHSSPFPVCAGRLPACPQSGGLSGIFRPDSGDHRAERVGKLALPDEVRPLGLAGRFAEEILAPFLCLGRLPVADEHVHLF